MKNLTGKHLAGQCLYFSVSVSASPVSPFSSVSPSPGPCSAIKMQRQSQVAILQYLKRFIDPMHIALASSILLSFSLCLDTSSHCSSPSVLLCNELRLGTLDGFILSVTLSPLSLSLARPLSFCRLSCVFGVPGRYLTFNYAAPRSTPPVDQLDRCHD